MRIKIKIDPKLLKNTRKAVEQAAELTMETLREAVVSAAVMPFNDGDMQNNETFVRTQTDGNNSITASLKTGSPQARRLYYHPEYNFQRGNNANAGGLWLQDWIDGDKKDFIPETFEKLLKKGLGK